MSTEEKKEFMEGCEKAQPHTHALLSLFCTKEDEKERRIEACNNVRLVGNQKNLSKLVVSGVSKVILSSRETTRAEYISKSGFPTTLEYPHKFRATITFTISMRSVAAWLRPVVSGNPKKAADILRSSPRAWALAAQEGVKLHSAYSRRSDNTVGNFFYDEANPIEKKVAAFIEENNSAGLPPREILYRSGFYVGRISIAEVSSLRMKLTCPVTFFCTAKF